MGFIQLAQLLPCPMRRGGMKMMRRRSLLLPLQTWQHWLWDLHFLTSSYGTIIKEFTGLVQSAHRTRR